MVEQITLSTNKIYEEVSLGRFKPLQERSNDRLFSQRILSISFYQQKVSKMGIVKLTGASTNEICQQEIISPLCQKYMFRNLIFMILIWVLIWLHCVKSVRIWSYSGPNFVAWGPEELQIWTIFTQPYSHTQKKPAYLSYFTNL